MTDHCDIWGVTPSDGQISEWPSAIRNIPVNIPTIR